MKAQDESETETPDRIWSVSIEGNQTFSDLVIKKYISNQSPSVWEKLTFFNEEGYYVDENEIRRDEIRIRRFYNRHGFDEARVTSRLESKNKEWKKALVFEIEEGVPIIIDSVDVVISGSDTDRQVIRESSDFRRQVRRLPYRPGERYQPVVQPEVEGRIVAELRKLGYPYATASVQAQVDTLQKRAEVIITASPGPRARFENVLVEGNTSLPERYIIREAGIDKGAYFNDRALREAQREVYNHHLFRFALVSIPEQVEDSTVDVQIRVRELSPRSIELSGGVGNFDRFFADSLKLLSQHAWRLLRAEISWTHRNMRNKGERFTTSASVAGFEQSFGLEYLFPYVLNTKSSVAISPYVRHKDEINYSIVSGGLNTSLIYLYSQNFNSTFSYDYSINNENLKDKFVNRNDVIPDSILSYNVSSFSLGGYYSRNLWEGRRGWTVQPYVELSGMFNEATYTFEKFSIDVRKFTPVTDGLVLATQLKGGLISYSGADSLPSDIRFYAGGTSSVRGYNRQMLGPKRPSFKKDKEGNVIVDMNGDPVFDKYVPLGGESVLSFNVELRQNLDRIIKGIGVVAFVDGGQVWEDTPDFDSRSLQFGAGGGLRYRSPIGPIGIDIGFKLNPDDEDLGIYPGVGQKGRNWRVHFSIGQAF